MRFATLALVVGLGLPGATRAAEPDTYIFDLLALQPYKGSFAKLVKPKTVPDWVKDRIDAWTRAAGITTGTLLRSINKAGKIWGTGFSPKVIWGVVKQKALDCEIPSLAPHDLRRTCARLCHQAGGELELAVALVNGAVEFVANLRGEVFKQGAGLAFDLVVKDGFYTQAQVGP